MASFLSRLRAATPDEASDIKRRASAPPGVVPAPVDVLAARAAGVTPGQERWPVKTGADPDAGQVGTVIVETTVREMGALPRPAPLLPDTSAHPELDNTRVGPVETTVWRLSAQVIALKMESDGDYHLVLQDDSGAQMVAEIPLPQPAFVAPSSPFFDDIAKARKAADQQFNPKVSSTEFARAPDGRAVPRHALQRSALDLAAAAAPPVPLDLTATTSAPQSATLFAMRVDPTPATITGVGFFDRAHGATGAAPNVVELHPVLDITFGA